MILICCDEEGMNQLSTIREREGGGFYRRMHCSQDERLDQRHDQLPPALPSAYPPQNPKVPSPTELLTTTVSEPPFTRRIINEQIITL